MIDIIMIREIIRTGIDLIVKKEEFHLVCRIQCRQNYRDRPRYEHNYRNAIRRGSFRGNLRMYQNQNFTP